MKTATFLLLALCFCSAELYAQEMMAQGWTVPKAGQQSSSTVSGAVTGNAHDPSRSSSGTLTRVVVLPQSGEKDRPPFPVLMPKAIVYPRKAVRRGWEGQTTVAVEVLPDGAVGRTALAKTSGHEVLDRAAEEAIQSWRFETESGKDEAVAQYVDIPVTFKLQNED